MERGGTSKLGLDLRELHNTTKARWSKDQRAFSFLIGIPVCQASATPTPFGATLSDSVGGSLLEFLLLRSCDRSASVSSSFPTAESRWVPAPPVKVALSLDIPSLVGRKRSALFLQRLFDSPDSAGRECNARSVGSCARTKLRAGLITLCSGR